MCETSRDFDTEEIEAVLSDTSLRWETCDQQAGHWQASTTDRLGNRIELKAVARVDGVHVSTQLACADAELSAPSQTAVQRLLGILHDQRRDISFTLQENRVEIAAFAATRHVARELSPRVRDMIAVVQAVREEVRALADPKVSELYLTVLASCDPPGSGVSIP